MPKKDDAHIWCICRNIGSEKHGYVNDLKAVFQRTLRQRTWQVYRNIVAIWMAAPLQYLLHNLMVVALEKVIFRNTKIPKTVC